MTNNHLIPSIPPVYNVDRIEIRHKHPKAIGIVLHCGEKHAPEIVFCLRPSAIESIYRLLEELGRLEKGRDKALPC